MLLPTLIEGGETSQTDITQQYLLLTEYREHVHGLKKYKR